MKSKHIIFFSSIILFMIASLKGADTAVARRDGNLWLTLSEENKKVYVAGFLEGTALGAQYCMWGNYSGHPSSAKTEDEKMDAYIAIRAYSAYKVYVQRYLAKTSSAQLASGLDSFYSDLRNRKITVSKAIWIVLRQIACDPIESISEMIENHRKSAEEDRKKEANQQPDPTRMDDYPAD